MQVLLLDEITVDMDVVGRLDLLQFFVQVWFPDSKHHNRLPEVHICTLEGAGCNTYIFDHEAHLPGRLLVCGRAPVSSATVTASVTHVRVHFAAVGPTAAVLS